MLNLLRLMRPIQWIKNGFVFTGLIFGHQWNDLTMLWKVVGVAAAFCAISSSIYVMNDVIDREKDRNHPTKKNRPVAARKVTVNAAFTLSILLAIFGLILGFNSSLTVVAILFGYLILNIAYSLYLKNIVILDVFCIATGFMLRILAGTIGVGIPPSKWLLLCGLMVTLFLGFTKRRAEIIALKEQKQSVREVLISYGPIFLDELIAITATCVIISYSLYTMSTETILIHNTPNLIYTVPFVVYALFRYIFLLHHRNAGQETSRDLLSDWHILAAVAGYFITLTILLLSVSIT